MKSGKALVWCWVVGGGRREGPFSSFAQADAYAEGHGGRIVPGTLRAPFPILPTPEPPEFRIPLAGPVPS